MAYMRGQYYLWDDEGGLHIWAKDGYDSWDTAGWACGDEEESEEGVRRIGYENASGTSIPMDVMDAYVMMRLAQILYEGKADEAIDRAIDRDGLGGNIGSMVLRRNAEKLKQALVEIKMDAAEPYVWQQDAGSNVVFE